MKKVLSILITMLSVNGYSSKARFCLDGHLVNAINNEGISSFSCNVEQTLTWENRTAFFCL